MTTVIEWIGQFIIYVLAFWGLWKTFDTVFHLFVPKQKCSGCEKKLLQIKQLEQRTKLLKKPVQATESDYLRKRVKQAEDQAARWRRKALERVALQKLNTCSPEELQSIYGCGPVSAHKLIRNRPLNTLEEANRLIPGRSVRSILNWAEQFV